jgi:hypothetical protein
MLENLYCGFYVGINIWTIGRLKVTYFTDKNIQSFLASKTVIMNLEL